MKHIRQSLYTWHCSRSSECVSPSIHRVYVRWSLQAPEHSVGAPPRRSGVKVYVLTSWCKWIRYRVPRPSPQPLHRLAICAVKSGNSAPRTKHLENQLDLFLHGRADCQTTQGFFAHNVLLHHLIIYFTVSVVFICVKGQNRELRDGVTEDAQPVTVNDSFKGYTCFF